MGEGDENLKLFGYKKIPIRTYLFYILSVLSLGSFRLLCHWKVDWLLYFRARKSSLEDADYILVIDEHQTESVREVRTLRNENGMAMPRADGLMDTVKGMRFGHMSLGLLHDIADENECGLNSDELAYRKATFGPNLIDVKLRPIWLLLFKEAISPFYIFQVFSVTVWFIDGYVYYAGVIVAISVISIVIDVCQIRSQEKKLRAMVHSTEMVNVIRNGGEIHNVSSMHLVPGDVLVIPRHGCVLPCDVALLNGTVIVSEAMLTGESVPVTKVAVSVHDSERSIHFDLETHAKHVLFCGTNVLQTRYYAGHHVKAVVLRTAFSTLKGQLVRSIMYPKPIDFRFTRDLFKFVGFLSCLACVGFVFTIVVMSLRGAEVGTIVIRALDIITIVVPPALPAAMSIGIIAANLRLRKKHIFCISPSVINTCGATNVVCFDKTGTLTEDGLDFHRARALMKRSMGKLPLFTPETATLEGGTHGELIKAIACCHSLTRIDGVLTGDPLDLILFEQTRWSLTEGADGMAEDENYDSIQPMLLRPPNLHPTYGGCTVLRQFPFSSSLQRMSVIVQAPHEADSAHDMTLYVKGSPEMIRSLCHPETIPMDFDDVIAGYARHGFRIIAVAKADVELTYAKAHKVPREEVEHDLELLGVIVLENRIKPETTGVIEQLTKADIRSIMVTGDNLLTATSVARESLILNPTKKVYALEHTHEKDEHGRTELVLRLEFDPTEGGGGGGHMNGGNGNGSIGGNMGIRLLGSKSGKDVERASSPVASIAARYQMIITGPTFAVLTHEYPELLDLLVCSCAVFARMSPDQKQALIHHLQAIDYTVVMCGDGANDCAALKAAHAGISLSEAEASIAAPFTSRTANIACVPAVIAEGRAALVTSFGVFQYMAGYSMTQFMTVLFLYTMPTNLVDLQFLYIDFFLITMVAMCFGSTHPCRKLSMQAPPTRLLSLPTIISVFGQLAIIFIVQTVVFFWTEQQIWYPGFIQEEGNDETPSYEGTALFIVTGFQYMTLAVAYSKGAPFRKGLLSNKLMCGCLGLTFFVHLAISIFTDNVVSDWVHAGLSLKPIPTGSVLVLLAFAAVSAIVGLVFEKIIVAKVYEHVRRTRRAARARRDPSLASTAFERLLLQSGDSPSWVYTAAADPPASPTAAADAAAMTSSMDTVIVEPFSLQEGIANPQTVVEEKA
ncbi:hypothetical protein PRIPAC_88295 [Pristionchus pacificus]|uniref:Cation-transporting ATPase n=1 Tax=Pristionchus pacificus TaxID=54126 RepID=A0A2A6CX12_PRIPA|nr:hypothetical protein PRIPAC_88295 [Pristionchus pacificus]|eukprot:PDM82774.1 hydrolase [Pristionchus pacificus]